MALKSEIETLTAINQVKEKELVLLRRQLAESQKLLKLTNLHFTSTPSVAEAIPNLASTRPEPLPSPSSKLIESFSSAAPQALHSVFAHLERVLGVKDIRQLTRAIDQLTVGERKYSEVVKTVCMKERVNMNQVSHAQLLAFLSRDEPLVSAVSDQVNKRAGVAWTFS